MSQFIKKMFLLSLLLGAAYAGLLHTSYQGDMKECGMHLIIHKARLSRQPNEYQILILGDSRALAMNSDAALAGKYSIFNLATVNLGGMYPYYHFLKTYLKNNSPPAVVLLSVSPLQLTGRHDIFSAGGIHLSGHLYRSSRIYPTGSILKDSIFQAYPRIRMALLSKKFTINKLYEKWKFDFDPGEYHSETGFLVHNTRERWRFDPEHYTLTTPLMFSQQSLRFLEQTIQTAQSHKVKIMLFNMPVPESIYIVRKQNNFYQRFFSKLGVLEKKYSDVLTLNRDILHYPDSLFSDGSHLNHEGVERFNQTDYRNLVENEILPHVNVSEIN
jgi:hypothetical protein